MLYSIIIAFAMYSKIPMPVVDWNEKNMRYVMAMFPFVGIAIGALEILAFRLTAWAKLGDLFRTALLVLIPVFVTGGIHLDGFMDTMDARSSWGDMEKKLEILKDSHTGAFAILGCVVYFVCSLGVWSEVLAVHDTLIYMVAMSFFFSRCLSGLGVTVFRCAKNSGLAHTFHSAAHKNVVRRALFAELAVCMAAMLAVDWKIAIPEIAAGLLTFAYYRWFSYREFGGINGDMAGYFLSLCELFMVLAAVLTARLPI